MPRFYRPLVIFLALALLFSVTALAGCTTATVTKGYEKAILTARSEIWKDISAGKASSATVAINGRR